MADMYVLNTGRTRYLTLTTVIARNIQYHAATSNLDLKITHIPGKSNVIADLLSRWSITADPLSQLSTLLPRHDWDLINSSNILID